MKSQLRVLAVTAGLLCAATGFAQTTAAPEIKPSAAVPAPAAPSVKGTTAPVAATPAAAPAVVPAVTPPAAPAAPVAKTGAAPAAKTAAAGGGAGKVWVNTASKTYHCEGAKYYGKTKAGEYLTEADAKAKGYHADHGKACAK